MLLTYIYVFAPLEARHRYNVMGNAKNDPHGVCIECHTFDVEPQLIRGRTISATILVDITEEELRDRYPELHATVTNAMIAMQGKFTEVSSVVGKDPPKS